MAEVPEAVKWGLGAALPRSDGGFLAEPPLGGEFFAYFVTEGGEYIDVSDRIRALPEDLFEGYRVADIMTPAPHTVSPSADVGELARHLLEWKVHRALVVESGRLEGIVTTTDVLKVLAAP
jgi:CBS domain-containing protein